MKFHYLSLENCASAGGIVIAIDVLRAFSTAAYAFDAGVESISLVASVQEALEMKVRNPGWLAMGEVGGLPPEGFDFGNSPTTICGQDLAGRHMVQRTSAGTQGIVRSVNAQTLLAASFVVAGATVDFVRKSDPAEVSFVITGGEKNAEDLACAEYLQACFSGRPPDPQPFIQRVIESEDAERHHNPDFPKFPFSDLDYCTRINAFDFAMPVSREHGRLVLRPVRPDANPAAQ